MGGNLLMVVVNKLKIQSEQHSNVLINIMEIRCDLEYSARYLALEDNFVKVSQEKDNGSRSSYLFKMPHRNKILQDSYMQAVNNMGMWAKSTMDENGKCMLQDRQGRDLICGDGLMNQYFRYASKYNYAQMSMNVMNDAMAALSQKCESPTGNRLRKLAWAA